MSFHTFDGGSVEIVAKFGHGRNEAALSKYRGENGFLISEDGDGHYTVWSFSGNERAAAAHIGQMEIGEGRPVLYVARLYTQGGDNMVSVEPAPDDLGREVRDQDGEIMQWVYDPAEISAKYPDVVAWG